MRVSKLFTEFFESEKASGIVLIICTLVSLFLANSVLQENYGHLWHYQIGHHSVEHWINDGLMTIFFLLIGLELEREVYIGELSKLRNALLPIIAALGGMLVPAGIYMIFNHGTPTQSGAGIPMATDIAFALGVLSLLGSKVPTSLKVFLTALAVIDDLGAILVIALFYTDNLSLLNLGIALAIMGVLFVFNRMKVNSWIPYIVGGIGMWYFMLNSGIHATISGVLLAFVIPFGDGSEKTISYKLQHLLHKPVAFFILPVFALANTAIVIGDDWMEGLKHENSIGIFLGLVAGKPLGILLFCFLAAALGLCQLPKGLKWKHIFATGFMAGIGFTMSIFITLLAFKSQPEDITISKIAIMISSLVAGIIGYVFLNRSLKNTEIIEEEL
ncbi:Na+/H+ antiporter NhaA [Flavobacterium saliperosum S13]|uniref:Na(+)/H(+) antiporter NhaA n=2 Tax=Flavobacterium saliperosum TaxID=329186 RepID=A0A1G4VQL5_9FLAO|nr:Na+/H+ antiporter NhaA [Flavobacterium saliperosum]ESU23840.1 Na+/H+ antiporter NhaA [Flavobacterium saliperosum S13]SCX10381.1 Na+:H+ antiporter, NhaA family [Flavobacterium saliperosum]